MIPCPYCGSTPILMQYRGVIAHRKYFAYRMTCSSCGASTLDCCTRNFAKWAWERGDVMRMTILTVWNEIENEDSISVVPE